MKKSLTAVFAAALITLPMLGLARTSIEAPYLSCVATYPVVSLGNAGRFAVVTNTDGPFMWVADSEDYGVYDAGATFVTPLTKLGTQQVTVVWGNRRASCFVDVVAMPGYGEVYAAPSYGGYVFGDYGYGAYGPNVTLTSTVYPRLPRAGVEPQTLAALAFSFVLLLSAIIALYPHAKKIVAVVTR